MVYIELLTFGFILSLIFSRFNVKAVVKSILWIILYFGLMILCERQSDYCSLMILIILIYMYKKEDTVNIKPKNFLVYTSCGIVLNEAVTLVSLLLVKAVTSATVYHNLVKETNIYNNEINGQFVYLLCAVGILAPLAEELLFRYMIVERVFAEEAKFTRIVVPAIMYGLAHQNIIEIIGGIILGLILDYLYIETKDFIVPLAIHMGLNIGAVFAAKTNIVIYLYIAAIVIIVMWRISERYNRKIK